MKQRKPFTVAITRAMKTAARQLAREKGRAYGFFFTTTGKCLLEPVGGGGAMYGYLWRSDGAPEAKR